MFNAKPAGNSRFGFAWVGLVIAVALMLLAAPTQSQPSAERRGPDNFSREDREAAATLFPATENPEVARTYAMAYIVGEYLKVRGEGLSRKDVIELTVEITRAL